jgi:hypothetical protein
MLPKNNSRTIPVTFSFFAAFFILAAIVFCELSRRSILQSLSDQTLFRRKALVGRAQRCLALGVLSGSMALGLVAGQVGAATIVGKSLAKIAASHPVEGNAPNISKSQSAVTLENAPQYLQRLPSSAVKEAVAIKDADNPEPVKTVVTKMPSEPRIADQSNPNVIVLHIPGNRRVFLHDSPEGEIIVPLDDMTRALPERQEAMDGGGQKWVKIKTLGGVEGWVISSAVNGAKNPSQKVANR